MASVREEKKAKFQTMLDVPKSGSKAWLAALAVVVLTGAVGGYLFLKRPIEQTPAGSGGSPALAASNISMTDLPSPTAENGKIVIPLATVKEKRLVWFTFGDKQTPVLAYTAPSGKVVTAISMCEPCRSDRFHIEDDELVCNACGTRWTLEDLNGISGGCPEYPPQQLSSEISGDQILISANDVASWTPRI